MKNISWRGALLALVLVLALGLTGCGGYKMSLGDKAKADRITSTMKDITGKIGAGTIAHSEFHPMFVRLEDDIDEFKATDSAPRMETFIVAVDSAYDSLADADSQWEADIKNTYKDNVDWDAIKGYSDKVEGHLAIAITEQAKFSSK